MRSIWREDLKGSLGRSVRDQYEKKIEQVVAELRAARLAANVTQDELAQELGTTRFYLSRLEQGNSGLPSIELLAAMAVKLGYSLEIDINLKKK